jgi:hypothetical protein
MSLSSIKHITCPLLHTACCCAWPVAPVFLKCQVLPVCCCLQGISSKGSSKEACRPALLQQAAQWGNLHAVAAAAAAAAAMLSVRLERLAARSCC